MKKTFRILEIVWLVVGCIGIIMSAYCLLSSDTTGAIYFLVFTFVSGIMYWVRKKQRIRFEAYNQQQENKNK